jgi:lambda family phage tail tape measure protein
VQLIDEEDLKRQADAADREIDRITKIFEDLRAEQKRAAEEIKRQGQAVFEATRTPAEQLAAELERLNKLLNAGAINWDTYSRAVFQAQDKFDDAMKKSKDTTKSLLEDIRDAAQGIGKQMTDAFVDFATTGKASIKDMVNSILADLARLMVQRMVTKPIFDAIGGAFGFANGGIMTSRGALPLQTYSRGGIANRPQVAVFGEGSTPEAYVPLPDGRRIPVAMQGGATSTNNVTVNVNVATGQTDTSSTGNDAAQLGNVISKAVQSEILRQQRPGGLLYGA